MTGALEGSCLFPLKPSSWVCCEEIHAMATPLCMAPASEPMLNIVFILPFLYHLNSSTVCHLSAIWPWTSIHSPFHMLGIRGDSVKAIVLHRAADVWPLLLRLSLALILQKSVQKAFWIPVFPGLTSPGQSHLHLASDEHSLYVLSGIWVSEAGPGIPGLGKISRE